MSFDLASWMSPSAYQQFVNLGSLQFQFPTIPQIESFGQLSRQF
jgi:hypothetical protein